MNQRGPWLWLVLALAFVGLVSLLASRHFSSHVAVLVFVGGAVVAVPVAIAVWAYRRGSRRPSRKRFRKRPLRIAKFELIEGGYVDEDEWLLAWRLYKAVTIGVVLLSSYLLVAL